MAYTTIKKPSDYFNTKLYTGTGSANSITGVGFQPDLVWIKQRNGTGWHQWVDAVRGSGKRINSNDTGAEYNDVNGLTSFDSDGFSLGTSGDYNGSGNSQVSWNWLASNTTASNTDGSISSTVSVNTTSGFSIVSYTGTGANATIGHGLGVAPKVVIIKNRDSAVNWMMYNEAFGDNTKSLSLNSTAALDTSANFFNSTSPTSTVFSVGTNANTGGASNFIAYCFADVQGFSKFGSYVGNGSSDGTFIYTGFKPSMIIVKRTDSLGSWRMWDNKRNPYNLTDTNLRPNTSDTDDTSGNQIDMLSNGFKIRATVNIGDTNASGGSYIYMAFAEEPLVGDNPATAR